MSIQPFAPENGNARRAAGPSPEQPAGSARRVADKRGFAGALGWTALGTLVPGLGLLRAGRKIAGSVVLAAFIVLVGGGATLFLTNRQLVKSFAFAPGVLQNVAIGLLVLAVAWVAVIGTSHLALRPPNPSVGQRAAGAAVVGILAFAIAAPAALGANLAWTTGNALDKMVGTEDSSGADPVNPTDPWANKPRLNLLILGGDSGGSRTATNADDRTDTVIVASIDTHTGATTLFTLPRNTERMPFPADSPLRRYYPNGFTSGSSDLYTRSQYLLNAMYKVVPTRVPHDVLGKTKDFGASVVKESVGEALGLEVDYFIKVNMDGFKDFINAIGGIKLNVNYRIPIGGQTDEGVKPHGYIEPGPDQLLNGRLALWYARGRYGLDDYKRMERQRCVINAVVEQTTPEKVFTNFQSIAAAGEKSITTDIPRAILTNMVDLGLKVKSTKLRSVVFDPKHGFSSSHPDWVAARKKVKKALKETAAGSKPSASASPSASSSKKPAKPKSDDLSDTCGYHPE